MGIPKCTAAGLAAALLLSACADLWPSASAPPPVETTYTSEPARAASPAMDSTSFEPGTSPGAPTGTVVGQRVSELRGDLDRLQSQLSAHNARFQDLRAQIATDSERYHGTVAAIGARLQIGTTPGNPILVEQFNSAEADLDGLANLLGPLNDLATDVNGDATLAAFLSEATRAAFGISGGVDEDHRQLAVLQDEVDRTSVLVGRLHKEVSDEIRRQTEVAAVERGNLNSLAAGVRTGELFGGNLINQAMAARGGGVPAARASRRLSSSREPLVVIHFDREDVPYERTLYSAVDQALARRPTATFDLVGVAPAAGDPGRVAIETTKARRHADDVARSLVDMGLPPSRVLVSTATSETAQNNQVRLYIQ